MTVRFPSMPRTPPAGVTQWRTAKAVETVDDEPRTIRFVASDETVDRYGDVVMADEWKLAPFKSNPIFLWMHDYREPIGKVESIGVSGKQLIATARFASAGASAVVDKLWRLVKDNVLRAVSVGFTVNGPDDWEYIRDERNDEVTGVRYLRPELLELSLVSVPANPNALALARAIKCSPDLISQALPDALVQTQQLAIRQRIAAIHIAGMRASAPR